MGHLDEQIERLKRCEYLKESEVKVLCEKAKVPFGLLSCPIILVVC